MKLFIVGSDSRIGRSLAALWKNWIVDGVDSGNRDIRNVDQISRQIVRAAPDVVVHCGANFDAQWCEKNTAEAFYANSLGCANVAMGALRAGARMVFFSGDEVFGGRGERLWRDSDEPQPLSVLGRSLFCGEKAMRTILQDRSLAVRGSWLYGFSDAADEDALPPSPILPIQVPADWYGTPTPFRLFADAVGRLMQTERASGVFHIGCGGICSRVEFWREYFRLFGVDALVENAPAAESVGGEPPDNWCGLENSALEDWGIPPLPGWKKALADWCAQEKSQ